MWTDTCVNVALKTTTTTTTHVAVLAQVVDVRRGFLRLGALSGAILSKRTRFILSSLVFCVLDSGTPSEKVPVSKFDEPEPGAVSGAVAEPHQMFVGWNSVKQLAAILGLYVATFFLLDATASPACLVAATRLARCLWWLCPSWASAAVVFNTFRWALRCCQLRCWLRLRSCAWGSAQ